MNYNFDPRYGQGGQQGFFQERRGGGGSSYGGGGNYSHPPRNHSGYNDYDYSQQQSQQQQSYGGYGGGGYQYGYYGEGGGGGGSRSSGQGHFIPPPPKVNMHQMNHGGPDQDFLFERRRPARGDPFERMDPSSHSHRHPHSSSSSGPKVTCFFCPERIPEPDFPSHLKFRHHDQQFWCNRCLTSSPFFEEAVKHLTSEHSVDLSSPKTAVQLVQEGFLSMPRDLRGLKCRLCTEVPKHILGQDRVQMKSHVRRVHDFQVGLNELKYECRACAQDFGSTEDFMRHGCCQFNGQGGHLPQPLCPELGNGNQQHQQQNQEGGQNLNGGEPIEKRLKVGEQGIIIAGEGAVEQCSYCEEKVPRNQRASHKGSKHQRLDFECRHCVKQCPYLSDLVQHLKTSHDYQPPEAEDPDKELLSADDLIKDLVVRHQIILPDDLRSLQCQLCTDPKFEMLAQDRYSLVAHMKKFHGETDVDRDGLEYKCRACDRKGFASTAAVYNHPCATVTAGPKEMETFEFENSDKNKNGGGDDEEENSENMVKAAIIWGTPESDPEDQRRMGCKLCGWQNNGEKFYRMIQHMQEAHSQIHKIKKLHLEDYVFFACSHCPNFDEKTVHRFEQHFDKESFHFCANNPNPDAPTIKASHKSPTSSRKRKRSETRGDERGSHTSCDPDARSETDIRRLECRLCGDRQDHCSIQPMLEHVKQNHEDAVSKAASTDELIFFRCSKCPLFLGESASDWASHFYKSFEWCRTSWRERKTEVKSVAEPVIPADEIDLPDLRQLTCNLCQFEVVGSRFKAMAEHLIKEHEKREDFPHLERQVKYGCLNCPMFQPPNSIKWDRHFSGSFRNCQGSSSVSFKMKNTRTLHWCDICQETREDFDKHVKGDNHIKIAKEVSEDIEDDRVLLSCDLCSIHVGTEANLKLHKSLPMHKKSVQEEEAAEDTTAEAMTT